MLSPLGANSCKGKRPGDILTYISTIQNGNTGTFPTFLHMSLGLQDGRKSLSLLKVHPELSGV